MQHALPRRRLHATLVLAFVCRLLYCALAGMFFASGTENCVLNVETESTQPQQVAQLPGEVEYFELRC